MHFLNGNYSILIQYSLNVCKDLIYKKKINISLGYGLVLSGTKP